MQGSRSSGRNGAPRSGTSGSSWRIWWTRATTWSPTPDARAAAKHSGLEISDKVIQVFTFEGEKCVRVHEFYDHDEAMKWVGASSAESPTSESG